MVVLNENCKNDEELRNMSKYEMVSTAISIIALALSVLIPVAQWAWKKWFRTAIVNYYPTGKGTLFFNQSGSYIQINGVIESKRKAVTIKNIKLSIVKQQNEQKLNLDWSILISPVNQSMLGVIERTTEAAHPFKVEEDSIICAFVEYSDPLDSQGEKIRNICNKLQDETRKAASGCDYAEAIEKLKQNSEYINAKNRLMEDFFWTPGKYLMNVNVEYDNAKKTFPFEFHVSQNDYELLLMNVDESLITQLKKAYNMNYVFNSPQIEIMNKQ